MQGYGSSVDWPDLNEKQLYVRDKKLTEMIKDQDFIDAIFHTWIQKKPTEAEKKMLNSVLVSFCGGWSILPPVIFSARLAATTKAPISQCLAAGFSASGPAHTAAIHGIMDIYLNVETEKIKDFVREKLNKKERIPGFGHPVVEKDPRPEILYEKCLELGVNGDAVKKCKAIEGLLSREKGVYANVDGINGAILVDLGFQDPSYGPALFLMGRSLSMTAHILEEMKNPPFEALKLVHPGLKTIEYTHK